MLPIVNTVTTFTTPPPTLVNTPLPETIAAVRVPADNVAPSFSNVQINNNARGNGGAFVPAESAPLPAAAPSSASSAANFIASVSASGGGASATFLAQLIGQSLPPSLQGAVNGYLVEYEKFVTNSFTKYKPSFASLPPPQPSGVYSRILEQQSAAPRPQPAPQPPPQPVETQVRQQAQSAPAVAVVAAAPPPVAQRQPVQQQAKPQSAPEVHVAPENQEAPSPAPIKLARPPVAVPSLAVNAYQASAARVDAAAPQATTV